MTTTSANTAAAASRPVADTVAHAIETPEREQPYGALGLKADEYAQIREILGRRPTSGREWDRSLRHRGVAAGFGEGVPPVGGSAERRGPA